MATVQILSEFNGEQRQVAGYEEVSVYTAIGFLNHTVSVWLFENEQNHPDAQMVDTTYEINGKTHHTRTIVSVDKKEIIGQFWLEFPQW